MGEGLPTLLEQLGLSAATIRKLRSHDIETVAGLTGLNRRELAALTGIGPATVEEIITALETRGFALTADPFAAYRCARHGEPRGDATLTAFWLCDECAERFITDALHGTRPEFVGEQVDGVCSHCSRDMRIRLQQWLLCPVCERVLRSIGRGLVAARHLLERWTSDIQPAVPGLQLIEIDQPRLRVRGSTSNAEKDVVADFVIRRDAEEHAGIELKTGKSRIGKGRGIGPSMSRFQLDISDCDDIERAARDAGYPIYVVHSQVIDRVSPPSIRYVPIDAWWASPFELARAFQGRSQRPRESKEAAYFDVRAFHPLSEFAHHITAGDLRDSVARFRAAGMPRLYR